MVKINGIYSPTDSIVGFIPQMKYDECRYCIFIDRRDPKTCEECENLINFSSRIRNVRKDFPHWFDENGKLKDLEVKD